MKPSLFINFLFLVVALVAIPSCNSHEFTLDDAQMIFDFSDSLPQNAHSKTYDIKANSQLLGDGSKATVWSLPNGELVCYMWIVDHSLALEVSPSDILFEMGHKDGVSFAVGDKAIASLSRKNEWFAAGYYEILVIRYSKVFTVITYSCLNSQDDFTLQSLAQVVVERLNQYMGTVEY